MNLANNTIDFVQQSSAEKSGQGDALTDLGGETMDLPSGRSGQLEAAETVHVEKHDLQSNPDDDLGRFCHSMYEYYPNLFSLFLVLTDCLWFRQTPLPWPD